MSNPDADRCSPAAIARTIWAKQRNSDCLELNSGCVSKKGITDPRRLSAFPHYKHQCGVTRAVLILLYPSATEPKLYEVKDLTALGHLADMELGNELPSLLTSGIALDGDMKTPFAIDVAGDVRIQPFLLIDRT